MICNHAGYLVAAIKTAIDDFYKLHPDITDSDIVKALTDITDIYVADFPGPVAGELLPDDIPGPVAEEMLG